MSKSSANIIDTWFEVTDSDEENVTVLVERTGGRAAVIDDLVRTVADHFVELNIVKNMGGFSKAAHLLRNRLPPGKKTRSGDLGEILATEFIDLQTKFKVPVRRLRFKDDRNLAMRGDDVLGFREVKGQTRVLKAEAKSRAQLSTTVIEEARQGLEKHEGRPNPGTLAFIEYLLRKENRDDEAEVIARLQNHVIPENCVRHLIFTLSGNDPTRILKRNTEAVKEGISVRLCGCHVTGHGAFVQGVFDSCVKLGDTNGDR